MAWVYVGAPDPNLYPLNAATGAKLWNNNACRLVFSSPAMANGVIYIGSYDASVYAFICRGTENLPVANSDDTHNPEAEH